MAEQLHIGCFVNLAPEMVKKDVYMRTLGHRLFKVIGLGGGRVDVKCVGPAPSRAIILGLGVSDVTVNQHYQKHDSKFGCRDHF